jgi:hypothetical protein
VRIVLAGVPHSPPFSPQLALPLLAAGLQQRSHQVAIIDGSLAAMERLWSQAAVAAGFEHLRTMTSGRTKGTSFPFDIPSRLQKCGCDVDDVDSFLQELRCALALLRGHLGESRFRLPDAYDHAIRVVQLALGMASVPFLPECADLRTYRPPRPIRTPRDLIAHANRSQEGGCGDTLPMHLHARRTRSGRGRRAWHRRAGQWLWPPVGRSDSPSSPAGNSDTCVRDAATRCLSFTAPRVATAGFGGMLLR